MDSAGWTTSTSTAMNVTLLISSRVKYNLVSSHRVNSSGISAQKISRFQVTKSVGHLNPSYVELLSAPKRPIRRKIYEVYSDINSW